MDEKPIIEVANLTKRFSGRAAINNITFNINDIIFVLIPMGNYNNMIIIKIL